MTTTVVVLILLVLLVGALVLNTIFLVTRQDDLKMQIFALQSNLEVAQRGSLTWKQEYEQIVKVLAEERRRNLQTEAHEPLEHSRELRPGAAGMWSNPEPAPRRVAHSSPSVPRAPAPLPPRGTIHEEVVATSDVILDQVLIAAATQGLREGATVAVEETSRCEPSHHHHHSDHSSPSHSDHGSHHICASSSGHSCSSSSSCSGGSSCGGGG